MEASQAPRSDTTILLTLPAFNEEAGLPKLLESFQSAMKAGNLAHRLVICDDGSSDRTRAVAGEWSSRMRVDLVVHDANRGLGETIRDALQRASELAADDDLIVTMDADNTHSPSLIPEMIRRVGEGADVVIASRYRSGSQVVGLSGSRHLMSWGARILFQVLFPIPGVRDYTCGFRAYRPTALRKAFVVYGNELVTERGFACMAEILLKMARLKAPMSEVPMVLRYDQKGGVTKVKLWRTVVSTIKLTTRTRFQ